MPDWIGAHVRMLRFLGGVPRLLVPDNLKSGVNRASFYDPEINRSYARMADHYGLAVLPARPRKPKDKAKVEAGVRFVQRAILGGLRNQVFFSLAEANAAIAGRALHINQFVMRRLGTTRKSLFEAIDRPALKALPAEDYAYAEWKFARVGLDYYIEIESFYYSVPHALIRAEVEVRITERVIARQSPCFALRCSIWANGWPATSAAMAGDVTAPIRTTCQAPIAAMPNGPPSGLPAGRRASDPTARA